MKWKISRRGEVIAVVILQNFMSEDFHPYLIPEEERAKISERLRPLPTSAIIEICESNDEDIYTRFFAVGKLNADQRSMLLNRLVYDQNDSLWPKIFRQGIPEDAPRLRQTLWRYFNTEENAKRKAALMILAKFGDEDVPGICKALIESNNSRDRNLAATCLTCFPFKAFLREYSENETKPSDTRLHICTLLIQQGDKSRLKTLVAFAVANEDYYGYYAAMTIYHNHCKLLSFELCRAILNGANVKSQSILVQQVANWMGDHTIAKCSDALLQTQNWIQRKLTVLEDG